MLLIKVSKRAFVLPSSSDVPERYAKNPGIIGNTHGERKDISPATNATVIDKSPAILEVVIYISNIFIFTPTFWSGLEDTFSIF